jgi:hypothetical protein
MKLISLLDLLFKSIANNIKRKPVALLLLIVVLCQDILAQNTANMIIQPSSTTITSGQTFTVSVRLDFTSPPATSSVSAVEIHLTFDKTKDTVISITKPASGALPSEPIPLQSIGTINTNGQINYAASTTSSFPNTDFDILTITFRAIGGGGTSTPLTFLRNFPANFTDAVKSGSSILVSPFVINGTVNIQNCTPPTATIATSSATCNGQPVSLKLASATGVSPYSLVVNGTTYNNVTVGSTFATIPFPTYNFWTSAPTPTQLNNNDGPGIEVGVKFRSSVTGFINGIRYYVGSSAINTSHTGKIWNTGTGVMIGSATFTPGAGGWQQVLFSSPVSIAANTTYIASCFSSSGYYNETDNSFASAVTNGPLTISQDGGPDGANGIYKMGAGMPNTPYISTNYFVDVVFSPNSNSFNLTSVSDASLCTNTGALQTLNVTSADCSTLPVTLLNLSASPNGRKVTLSWNTSSEINNRGFNVERSSDGVNWSTIGFVNGAGNSSSVKSYSYPDNNLDAGRYYYRLKQVDIDDRYKYSVIVSAVVGGKGEYALGQNYPNPFSNQTTIQFTLPQSSQVNISLFDISGRVVKVLVNGAQETGTHAISFNAGSLTRGVYYYKIQAGNFTDVKKLTIQ